MGLDARLLRQARTARWALTITILMGLAGALTIILQARQISRIVARVFMEHQSLADVQPLMLGLLVVFALRALFHFIAEGAAGETAMQVKAHLRDLLMHKLLRLGPVLTRSVPGGTGAISASAVQGIDALEAYFSQFLPQLALAALIPLSILVVVFPLDWLTGVVLLVTAPLIPLFMILIGNAAQAVTRKQWTAMSRMSAFFLDTLQGLTTLKLLGRSREHAARIADVSEKYRAATMNVLRISFLSALVLELVGTISTAVVAVEIGLRLLHYRLEFEQAFFILMIAPEFYWPLRQLGLRFHAGMSGTAAARKIFEILDLPEPETVPATDQIAFDERSVEVEFQHVSYTYPGSELPALRDVSFSIRPGQKVALVGASGAGKSTLLQLVLGFIQPQSGVIRINGRALNEIDLQAWRGQLAWVPQIPYLFHGTIGENICLGQIDADPQSVQAAAQNARLHDWIVSLPQGYDTSVGEQGARLSGGQAQRISLARAFLRNAPLLILDEPTAHLDPREEWLLEGGLQDLSAGRTMLVAAHRLPTVMGADQILVMDGGRVAEMGSHAELMAQNGIYARLVRSYEDAA